ncbi:hypothetical protein ABZ297_41900 [Nonomuraea sp. NPDC005983]|uniref:hypothetical protein n=1 Tax=Nonomuraea sp. NPDC005983 TaxID=3155595 RepID=UPI0033A3572A
MRLALGRAGIGERSALFQRGAVERKRGHDAHRVAAAAAAAPSQVFSLIMSR